MAEKQSKTARASSGKKIVIKAPPCPSCQGDLKRTLQPA